MFHRVILLLWLACCGNGSFTLAAALASSRLVIPPPVPGDPRLQTNAWVRGLTVK